VTAVPESIRVSVYRSERRADTYLYLPAEADFDELPEALRTHFGVGVSFLQLELDRDRYLAQADAAQVMQAINDQGFFLQLPPSKEFHDG
jgi:uncharacterized protein